MAKKTAPTKKVQSSKIQKKEVPKNITNMSEEDKMKLGVALFSQESYVEAIEVFSRITEQENLLARQYLARSYYRLEMYKTAYQHFSFLVENANEVMKDYCASMVAAIDMMWGNYGRAIANLKSLPDCPRNRINLALAYWKKYKNQKEEFSIMEAMRLLRAINLDSLSTLHKQIIFNLFALFHQAQRDYYLAEDFYQKAIETAESPVHLGAILTDYASLHIELTHFEKAKELLLKAQELITDKSSIDEAYNNKWLGILASILNNHVEACEFFTKAAQVIHERDLLRELANTLYILADSMKNKDFYKAAEYFADGLNFEKLSEEVKDRDEKIVMFYYRSFFNTNHDTSGIG